jgi:hypothetical protein
MKKKGTIIFFFFITTVCYSQVADDFSDGDFSISPVWSGATAQFTVNASHQLQLNNTVAGSSYLTTAFNVSAIDNYEWQGYVKQSFSPSGSNFGRVYLVSDQANLSQPLNGYYLQFGEGGSNDAVELFRQSGSISVSICRGANATIATSFSLRFKVTRDNSGNWSLYVDHAGGTNFTLEATGMDVTFTTSNYFGVSCTYTVSNATKFYYDDFLIQSTFQQDVTPPTVSSVDVLSSTSISIIFSEALDATSSQNISNYSGSNTIGNPASAQLQPDGKTIILNFSSPFVNGVQNQITVSAIQDLAGNIMTSTSLPFLFFQASPVHYKDIIFTEIFADPSPQVGLPNAEYVEIYNRSSNPIDLAGWIFSDGTSNASFGSQIIFPGQYWIITSLTSSTMFSGNVIGVSNFPTLNNTGDNLTLRINGISVDSVNYSLDWYNDTDKQDGGWSLELIDPNNTCNEGANWTSSEDISGGTPGKQNSVFANKPDLTGPKFESVIALSDSTLLLSFDEKIEKELSNVSFSLDPLLPVSKFSFTDLSLTQIKIELQQKLQIRILYTLTLSNLTDCAGNFIQPEHSKLSFALPEASDSLDLVINEILFNPRTAGVDFVEVYNKSSKYINLKNWKLSNIANNQPSNLKIITATDFILAPSSYIVFTSDPSIVISQYPKTVQKNLFTTTLPSLPDDQGSVALVSENGKIIDSFYYTEKFHSPFVKDNEGVSLERVSFAEATNESANWKSANASAGFATPGYVNSNTRPESLINENTITIEPEIFSPLTPGLDFTKINYRFNQSGVVANIKVLDAQGRLIKTVANNETLASEGFYRWDGDREDGSHARFGYYVVWVEVFDGTGYSQIFRKRAVIGK